MMLNHLSHSSIDVYLRCHRGWKFKYIDEIPEKKNAALLFGATFHEAIESYILSRGSIVQSWVAAWDAKLTELDGQIDWQQDTPESLCNDGIRILTHEDILPVVDALVPLSIGGKPAIERHVEFRVPGVPVPVIGYIDMIEQDGVPVDFKTSGKSWPTSRAENELQPLFYLAALNQSLAWLEHGRRFRHYIFVRNKTPKCQTFETQHSSSEIFWLFDLIRECWQSIQKENFAPTGANSYLCSERYCSYWGICRGR